MNPSDLQSQLTAFIAKDSGTQDRRPFIGLSEMYHCPWQIYDRYLHGVPASVDERLKFAVGNDLHEMMVDRLTRMGLYRPAQAIDLFDGLIQGHPDGVIEDDLLEIKTIEREEWFPDLHKKLPGKMYWQVQAYMFYGGYPRALAVYLARNTGRILAFHIQPNRAIAARIDEKASLLLEAVKAGSPPKCECGRCIREQSGRGVLSSALPLSDGIQPAPAFLPAVDLFEFICPRCGKKHANGVCPKAIADVSAHLATKNRRARRYP